MERPDFNQWKAREVARLLALVESERRYYQEIVATLPVPLVVLSADRLAISANRAFRQAFQLRGEDLRSHSIDQLVPVPELAARIQEAQTKGTASEPLVAKVGERTLRICVVPVRDWNGDNALETLLSVEDLGAAETRPPVPVDLPAILWQADAESLQFQSAHGSVEEMLGYPVEHWTSTLNFFEERIFAEDRPAALALYRSAIDRGSDASAEFRAVSADGALVWCRESIRVAPSASTAPRLIIGVITNIARRKELEGQWLSAARTEALQTLAGRLAHDLNNPLMVIAGYTEDVLFSLAADDPRRADLGQVLTASGRVGEVTQRLVEFSRKQAQPAEQVNLNPRLRALEPEIAQAAGSGVVVEMRPPPHDLWALANGAQLKEVILALASAHEGSPGRTRLTVSWESDVVAEAVGSTLSPGCYSRIALQDDGHGLTSTQRASLFDAVLTPKDASAPGPALSRTYQIVREWGGGITVQSASAKSGNIYALYLPHAEAPIAAVAEPPPILPVALIPVAEPEPQRETILVVDDEAGIRGLMRKILKRERYRVLEAGNAEEALAVSLTHDGPIDLLLTDVMMPGLTGPELAKRMCEAAPDLKVLFISGYAPDEALQTGSLSAGHAFLAKPFTLGALVGKVRETLDAPGL